MTYTEKVLADLKAKNPDQPEFIQAATFPLVSTEIDLKEILPHLVFTR